MLLSGRLHLDNVLEDRVNFIMKEYEYICKDESNLLKAIHEIEEYSGKKLDETWEDLEKRTSYGDLVKDLKDVFDLLQFISEKTEKLDSHFFFIAPKIDFRQPFAPNFLCE